MFNENMEVNLGRKYQKILKIPVNSTSLDRVLAIVAEKLSKKERFYIVTPNPEIILKASKSPFLARIISDADFSIPDGVGLKYAAKFLDGTDLEIIPGKKLFWEILKIADRKKLKIVLFGGVEKDAENTKTKIGLTFKNLDILAITPPIFDENASAVNDKERLLYKKMTAKIKMFQPSMIFIGLTTPKQEKWIRKNFYNFPSLIGAMCVGDTFGYLGGRVLNPPKWVESLGFEWFFRLLTQPKRIKRVFNASVIFPIKVVLWKFGVGKK